LRPRCAKSSGYKLETARSNLFDFAWNVRAGERAGHMPRHGHFSLWLVDTLARLCDGWLEPNTEAYPPTLRGWRRTRLDVAPLTTRGIDWPSLKALTGAGAQAIGLSTLERPEEVQAVLQHGALAAAGDAAGIERATGLRTSGARLQRVVARVCAQAASDAMLNTAGVVELQARLYGTAGDAPPRELVVSAPPRSAVQPDAQGPLPFDAGQAGGARSAAAVVEPAPPLSPPSEDEAMDGGGQEGSEGGEDGGEDGGEGGEVCTCGKRYCKCPWYVAMSKEERRSLKQKGRDKKRPRSQKDQKNRGERSRRKSRHEQVAPPQSPPPGGTAPNSAVASPLLDQLRQAATRALGM